MASPAEIGQILPDTLPEDFGEWDGGESQTALSIDPNGPEHARGSGAVPMPAVQPAEQQSAHASQVVAPQVVVTRKDPPRREPPPSTPATYQDREAFLRQLDAIGNGTDKMPSASPQPAVHATKEASGPRPRPSSSETNGMRSAASSTPARTDAVRNAPSAAPASSSSDDEAFLRQLKAIGSALNNQPVSAAQARTVSRATEDVPSISARSNSEEGRRWPAKLALATAAAGRTSAVGFPSFQSDLADTADENPIRKKWMMIAASLASLVLLVFLGVRLFSSSKPSMAKQTVTVVQPTVTDTDAAANTPKPSPATQLASNKPSPAVKDDQAVQPVDVAENTPSPEAAQRMSDQLTASPLIPRDIKEKAKEDAPPPPTFAADGMSGSSTMNPVFGKQSRPTIAYVPPQHVTISAGVAGGLLIHRTEPVYPPIAKATRVEGTVVIQATVTKTGLMQNFHVVSGPAMLRQAALDAVTTWRYKPYMVNNEPTEVQTTVSVVFRLGQ